jgi:SAM-dependent methyltransferase
MPALDYERVAALYDSYVTADFDLEFFLAECRDVGGPVLELTSGTGRLSLPLIEAGIDLVCVDSSPAMIGILRDKLRRRGLHAETHAADISQIDLARRFPLIFIPFHSFAEITGRDAQLDTLRVIRGHLAPGGCFICTLHNPAVRLRTADGLLRLLGHFPLQGGTDVLRLYSQEHVDPATGDVWGWQYYEVYSADGTEKERFRVDLRFSAPSHDDFSTLAEAAGFAVADLWGDYRRSPFDAGTSPVMIWTLVHA